IKGYLGLILFLGSACTSSAVLAQTDADLMKKLEILEARIAELEGRLERKARADGKGHDSSGGSSPSGAAPGTVASTSGSTFVPAAGGVEARPQGLAVRVGDLDHPGEKGWHSPESMS